MKLELGQKLKLAGKTIVGKEIIKNHGEQWSVLLLEVCPGTRNKAGALIQSSLTKHIRWVLTENDRQFTLSVER